MLPNRSILRLSWSSTTKETLKRGSVAIALANRAARTSEPPNTRPDLTLNNGYEYRHTMHILIGFMGFTHSRMELRRVNKVLFRPGDNTFSPNSSQDQLIQTLFPSH